MAKTELGIALNTAFGTKIEERIANVLDAGFTHVSMVWGENDDEHEKFYRQAKYIKENRVPVYSVHAPLYPTDYTDRGVGVMWEDSPAAKTYREFLCRCAREIAEYTERHNDYESNFRNTKFHGQNNLDKISHAVCSMAVDVDAKAIAVCSVSGKTAMLVSRFRTPVDIVGMTTDPKIWRRLSMSWGVTPVLAEDFPNMDVMFYFAKQATKEALNLQKGDNLTKIALAHHTTVERLVQLNHISNPNLIRVGQKLLV